MKIGILTQPLHNNYGGLLQAYALQTALVRLGHDATTIDIWKVNTPITTRVIARRLYDLSKRLVRRFVMGRPILVWVWPTKRNILIFSQYTRQFVDDHIQTTPKIANSEELMSANFDFDAYVVGSDQVWRPKYSPNIYHYFLDFVDSDESVKKISYAASFGVGEWEYTEQQTRRCSKLVRDFDAISVREDSAVDMCRKHLGVEAVHTLDPTMLLEAEDYQILADVTRPLEPTGGLMTYILDSDPAKTAFVDSVSKALGFPHVSIHRPLHAMDIVIHPPVSQWIQGFSDAQYVITDSFHGTVFAILFRVPFLSLVNPERGGARFNSLLELFGLSDRLVRHVDAVSAHKIAEPIDWIDVHRILELERDRSFKFLLDALE